MDAANTISDILATPGLIWLAALFGVAGVVRGFAGFGTALIVMPVAAALMPMPVAIALLTFTGTISWPILVPRAVREAHRREVLVLAAAAIITAPVGVWLLGWVERDLLRWLVSFAAMGTLAALLSGWRYRGRVTKPGLGGIGAVAGLLGGTTGLTGPPVILFYLAGQVSAQAARANTILFLALLDIGIIGNLFLQGQVTVQTVWLGLALAVPYAIGVFAGRALFKPERERAFRALAYSVIGLAIVTGLPLFDG